MANPRWPTLLKQDAANRKTEQPREIKLWGNSKSLGRSLERFVQLKREFKSKIACWSYYTLSEIVGQRLSVSKEGGRKREENPKIKMAAEWGEGENGGVGVEQRKPRKLLRETQKSTDVKLHERNMSSKRCNDSKGNKLLHSFYSEFGNPSWANSQNHNKISTKIRRKALDHTFDTTVTNSLPEINPLHAIRLDFTEMYLLSASRRPSCIRHSFYTAVLKGEELGHWVPSSEG